MPARLALAAPLYSYSAPLLLHGEGECSFFMQEITHTFVTLQVPSYHAFMGPASCFHLFYEIVPHPHWPGPSRAQKLNNMVGMSVVASGKTAFQSILQPNPRQGATKANSRSTAHIAYVI